MEKMKKISIIFLFLNYFIYSVSSFASPFSDIWSVSKTFADGGFEGDVKVTVFESTKGTWKLTINFDRPVKGLQLWTGKVSDVGRDFTYYVIENQAWNGNLYAGSKLEFHILGYSQNGLPSLTIDFQGHVLGLSKGKAITPLEVDNNFQVDFNYVLASSLRFFESQKSGTLPKDQVVFWKQSSGTYDGGAEGVDLTGGYYISGDYVKFGYPMAFAMTQLAWGGLRYKQGYERALETINLLKTVKWGTDYFLKAHVEDNVFYGMVGDPSIEHGEWESGSSMDWRRPAYKLTTTDPGTDLIGETVAALCSTAMLFNSLLVGVDQQYSNALIQHAEQLYYFADMNRGRYDAFSIPSAKNFYPSTGYGDELAWAAIWLYRATNNQAYMDQALIKYDEFKLGDVKTEKGVDYDNKVLAIQLMLAEVTGDSAKFFVPVRRFCDFWSGPQATFTPDGILGMQGIKYPNKFAANTAFLCLMASDFVTDDARKTNYRRMATEQIEEILGKNSGTSYMVGYGNDFPKFIHDRDSSCPTPPESCGWGFFKSSKPNANTLIGAIVGGPGSTGKHEDSRKNFIGNQPSILINSAFQSAVAGVSMFFVQPSEVILGMDPHAAAADIFSADNIPKFDACISDPCDNDGECSNIAGLNYLCDCPDNVFGRNCEHRLVPVLKVTNTWPNGAELQLVLPNVKPNGAWQLRVIFPPECPLTDADIWNACLNVRDSNLRRSEIFMQQLGWQNNLDFIGIKFQFTSAVYFRNCLSEEAFRFVIVEEAAPWLGRFSPDDCPRQLPHIFEGGSGGGSGFWEGSGGFGGSGGSGDFNFPPVPRQATTVNYYQTPVPQTTQPFQTPPIPPTTTTIFIGPTQTPLLPVENQPLPPGEEPKPIFTEFLPYIEWMTQWGSGGQGHIQIRDSRPNEEGRWLLGMIVPPECVIKTFQFWGACPADSLSNPPGGHFVFEQVDWQVTQDFIGFTVHFHLANGIYSPECFKDSSYAFSYLESHAPYNFDVNNCLKEYKDLNPGSAIASRSFSLKADPNGGPLPNQPTPTIDPNDQWTVQPTVPQLPNVNNLQAVYVSDSSVELQWNQVPTDVDSLKISYSPLATDGLYFKNANIDQQYLATLYQTVNVAKDKTSAVMNNLEPGTNYQFEARNINYLGEGAPSSIYLTTTPLDVKDLRAVSINGNAVEISWQVPRGFHEGYKVTYFPQGQTGNPKSPFYLPGTETKVVVDGLTQNTDFIFSIVTQSGSASSEGIYTYTQTIINQCTPTTCTGSNEICENQPSGPTCNCIRGYAGNPCQDINECVTGDDVCHAEAMCQNTPGSHSCLCKNGYNGDGISCFDVNECAQNVCPNNCLNTIGSFQCTCPLGTNGDGFTCTDINECALGTANCPLTTSCINTDGSYTCVCAIGFNLVGTECIDLDECTLGTNDCDPSTICVNRVGSFDCNCDKNYEKFGLICIDIDECARGTHDCHTQATCTNLNGAFACVCNTGYLGNGRTCTDVDECTLAIDTCHPTTTCVNTLGSFNCICTTGFEKIGLVCQDIDECARGIDNCSPQATCSNIPATFACSCLPGYQGDGRTCTDVNECVIGTHGCSPDAVCSNLVGGHTCTCSPGFVGDGFTCTTVTTAVPLTDECSLGTHDCDVNAACIDTVNSFDCACRAGFTGDGKTCVDIDECSAGPISAICPGINRACVNMPGSFRCECAAGFEDDGTGTNTCIDINECTAGSHDCHVLAVCMNAPGTFTCLCATGFIGDGKQCSDVDECTGVNNCDVNADCTNSFGSYTCDCKVGYNGDGITCADVDECALGFCATNSICTNMPGLFTCACLPGYTGDGLVFCDDLDECLNPTACDINANCTNNNGSFDCVCNAGFTGDGSTCSYECSCKTGFKENGQKCEDINECENSNNCHNKSECINSFGSYLCGCYDGYHGNGSHCEDINECLGDHGCNKNAKCINLQGNFSCKCIDGYHGNGSHCKDINECLGNHGCNKNAKCINLQGNFSCKCHDGYHGNGSHCEDINECMGDHGCNKNAKCINLHGNFSCKCIDGYHGNGSHCKDINECLGNHGCNKNAKCINLQGNFSCKCHDGYHGNGSHCEDINECLGDHGCHENAKCMNLHGNFSCKCIDGYHGNGSHCEDINECLGNHGCNKNAKCINLQGNFSCKCHDGYHGNGSHCEDINECLGDHGCNKNAKCINLQGNFSCKCIDGYHGNGSHCKDINECLGNHGCNKNAKCINLQGNFSCKCHDGYHGNGSHCEDINECLGDHGCHENAKCMNLHGNFSCKCIDGYHGNGSHCEDINECLGNHGCNKNAKCINLQGNFSCKCIDGYHGNGSHCKDINECLGDHGCHENAKCMNLQGNFSCKCIDGYHGNGSHCEDINECLGNHGCHENAKCMNLQGNFSCKCHEGYHGNGSRCEDINECLGDHGCHENAKCMNLQGSFSCKCIDGYHGNRSHCKDINECLGDHGCHENAKCMNLQGNFLCECRDGFHGNGSHCEDINECLGNHGCNENAKCMNLQGSFSCKCHDGYHGNGSHCEDINECLGDHGCNKNAKCMNLQGNFSCKCRDGYHGNGSHCEDINECLGDHGCNENAKCMNLQGNFSCKCYDGYHGNGSDCDDINECLGENNCHENSNCTNIVGSYTCHCLTGFKGDGKSCEDINECTLDNDCHDDADCLNVIGSYSCKCRTGYFGNGLTCNDTNECVNLPCNANANCTNTKGSFSCQCTNGFTGDGFICKDVNECLDKNANKCHQSAECLNTVGAYGCSCYSGYEGNGFQCNDVNECATGQHKCNNLTSTCHNFPGGYNCDCLQGFRSREDTHIINCQDLNECYYGEHDCDKNAYCVNTIGSFNCKCRKYYEGDGKSCKALIDPMICQPRDIAFLVDRTSTPFTYGKIFEFIKNISFPFNLGQDQVQVGVATFYSKTFKSIYLRNGHNFNAINSALRKTNSVGTKRNANRDIGSAMRWVRERFLIPSQGKSRNMIPTSVVIITSGPSHDIIFNELLTYDSLNIDLTFVLIGEKTLLLNSTNSRSLQIANIIEAPSAYNLAGHVDDLKLHLCPTSLKTGIVKRREMTLTPYSHPEKCPSKASFDILFVIDSRTKIDVSDLEFTKNFIREIIQQFPIGINGTHIGIVQFALGAKTLLHLEHGTNNIIVNAAVNNMRELGKGQQIGKALSLARYVNFHPLAGRRVDHPGVVILLTGSKGATTQEEFEFWRKSFRTVGASVITVTLGSSNPNQLKSLSGESTVRVEKYDELLPKAFPLVLNKICKQVNV